MTLGITMLISGHIPRGALFWAIEILNKHLSQSAKVLDVGCVGGGCSLFLKGLPQTHFMGVDSETELIQFVENKRVEKQLENCTFKVADLFDLRDLGTHDGVPMIQTISWISGYKKALKILFEQVSPRWLFVTGLFTQEKLRHALFSLNLQKIRKVMYKTYSIPEIARFASRCFYESRIFSFHIDIDIAKPEQQGEMQSWTL